MNAVPRVILIPVALAGATSLGAWMLNRAYLAPRRVLLEQITQAETTLASQRQAQRDRRGVLEQLQGYVDRTLGPDVETVDHRLRSRLNRLAEQARLQGVSVSTEGAGKPRLSPARLKFRGASQAALREELDFIEIEASISGVGTLAEVVRLISLIESEPWLKCVSHVRLDPRDNGARLAMTLRLSTLFAPGRAAQGEPISPTSADAASRFASLVQDNPFRVPPPPPPAEPPAAPAQPTEPAVHAAPPFAFGEWALTGVARGPGGVEAWLLHRPSGRSRVLGIGESLDAAVFAGSTGEAATFTLGDQRFVVAVGATMDQRSPG